MIRNVTRGVLLVGWLALGCSSSSMQTGGGGGDDDDGVAGDAAISDGSDTVLPPLSTPPQLLAGGLYPRAILASNGYIYASLVTGQPNGVFGGSIFESTDDGLTFTRVGGIDDPILNTGNCCATLYELPRALGALPAGTLLWATSVGQGADTNHMSIVMWASTDHGRTWTRHSTIVTATVPRVCGGTSCGLWEPELSMLDDGTLVCHFSDETSAAHSQYLVERRSSDGVNWSASVATVGPNVEAARPGMATVRRMPNGSWVMAYEVCGTDACNVHVRHSSDGWNWGDPNNLGEIPRTVDGRFFRHAPTLAFDPTFGANGRFFLVGQLAIGGTSQENGSIVLANTECATHGWYSLDAPVPVPAAYDNFCPNYSSPLLPLDHGLAVLEIATRWDGNQCNAYYARGPLRGSGDAAGISDGARYRLVSVMSSLCLDVSGGSPAPGTAIQQYTCNNNAAQNWTFTQATDGTFSLRSQISNLCLAVSGAPDAAGSVLHQEACDGGAAQAWRVENIGRGYYRLVHAGPNLCLDVSGGSVTSGAAIQQWHCNDLSPQIWRVEPH
jgi:hypothetical protein